ncbi:F-box/kelch-repeat protein SKIP25-like [Punica granatum]|uniref:F-box/kelch-repeat protein SKIP25-like n=1 Tax=Punica granatum TaxID=22663 RepID=A0A6P8DB24_PUNGR|nr:F-box/kelch-repeat protein SKIP25-like [Punica granatum]
METNPKLGKQVKRLPGGSSEEDHIEASDLRNEILLPGLPNHLAHRCLSSVHPTLLYRVCRSWRRLIYSPSFPPFFTLYALVSQPQPHMNQESNNNYFFCLDPLSSTWQHLPSPPMESPVRLLHRHPSFLSRKLSIQSVTVSDHLVLVAASNDQFQPALACPLVFRPLTKQWFFGPQISVPRRWCATGSVGSRVFVASGVGIHYRGDVARSMEEWDLRKDSKEWKWESKAGFKDGRFSREAIEAVGYGGKLCMVNVKGNAIKEGALYDVETDQWEEMPQGMVAGWNGPVAAMDESTMYVIDEADGALSQYDGEKDRWDVLLVSDLLKGAEQIAAARGRACVVCANGGRIAVVDVVTRPVKVWVVQPPPLLQVVALHILPRMTRQME